MQKETRNYKIAYAITKDFSRHGFLILEGAIVDDDGEYAGRFYNTINLQSGTVDSSMKTSLEGLSDMQLMSDISQKCKAVYELYKK